jgi:hypothetical protein
MEPDEHSTDCNHHHHNHNEEEEPPFALVDKNYPQHQYFVSHRNEFLSTRPSANSLAGLPASPKKAVKVLDSQLSTKSPPPGLAESILSAPTDDDDDDGSHSSAGSSRYKSQQQQQQGAESRYLDASSTFLMSSVPTITSTTAGGSSYLPHSRELSGHPSESKISHGGANGVSNREISFGDASRGSVGFSQLLQAADDKLQLPPNTPFGVRSIMMPVVPEEASLQTAQSWGTLISAGTDTDDGQDNQHQEHQHLLDHYRGRTQDYPLQRPTTWINDLLTLGETPLGTLRGPLVGRPAESSSPSTLTSPLLSYATPSTEIVRAREGIKATLIDEESFEVSVDVNSQITAQQVMDVLGNPELLRLWCEPIQALVVTRSSEGARDAASTRQTSSSNNNNNNSSSSSSSSSNHNNDTSSGRKRNKNDREYEGEWIEATTLSLISPPSNAGIIHGAVQAVMSGLGFSSYGKVTMFVERRRGQVGLTVGPFQGGVFVSHSIVVREEQGQSGGIRVRVVDRVRLTTTEDDELSLASMFLCGVLDSINSCLLPTVGSYMEQVTKSLIHLRGLVETGTVHGRGDQRVARESGMILPGS